MRIIGLELKNENAFPKPEDFTDLVFFGVRQITRLHVMKGV